MSASDRVASSLLGRLGFYKFRLTGICKCNELCTPELFHMLSAVVPPTNCRSVVVPTARPR
jgi:hypothetical protein